MIVGTEFWTCRFCQSDNFAVRHSCVECGKWGRPINDGKAPISTPTPSDNHKTTPTPQFGASDAKPSSPIVGDANCSRFKITTASETRSDATRILSIAFPVADGLPSEICVDGVEYTPSLPAIDRMNAAIGRVWTVLNGPLPWDLQHDFAEKIVDAVLSDMVTL